jgi:hypothetical protein
MGSHPSDEFRGNIAGRKLHHALIQKLAFRQKFDVSKDLLLARFGSSLAVRQEFGRRNLAGHGRECRKQADDTGSSADDLASDHEGLRTRLSDISIPRSAALFVLTPFLIAGKLVVNPQAICDGVQGYVNMLVDYTKTTCIPADVSDDTLTFLVLSSEPIFSVKGSKKAWLVAVVLSVGKAMNDLPDVKAGELYVADANMETDVAYFLPIDLAKSLQKEVSAGQMKLEAMYEEIKKPLVLKELPKP